MNEKRAQGIKEYRLPVNAPDLVPTDGCWFGIATQELAKLRSAPGYKPPANLSKAAEEVVDVMTGAACRTGVRKWLLGMTDRLSAVAKAKGEALVDAQ